MIGIEAFLEVLHRSGVRHIFGNPGTTELPLNAALVGDSRFQYLFGLHEIPVVTMAGGYAMASGGVGVANVHISCGLGNAMGMLYNAHCEGTPLLLTAGHQDQRLRLGEPVLEGDIVRVAREYGARLLVEEVFLAQRLDHHAFHAALREIQRQAQPHRPGADDHYGCLRAGNQSAGLTFFTAPRQPLAVMSKMMPLGSRYLTS